MELLCIQSQEHPELPIAELNAVMECEDISADIEVITEGLIVLRNISQENLNSYYEILTRRLGYTHEIHELIKRSDADNGFVLPLYRREYQKLPGSIRDGVTVFLSENALTTEKTMI